MYKVDLNSDLGESFGAYTIGMDSEILKYVSSANVACGFHAGDPLVMGKTVELAKAAGTAIGAHPGFPDLVGFGRRNLAASPAEAKADVNTSSAHCSPSPNRPASASSMSSPTAHSTTWLRLT